MLFSVLSKSKKYVAFTLTFALFLSICDPSFANTNTTAVNNTTEPVNVSISLSEDGIWHESKSRSNAITATQYPNEICFRAQVDKEELVLLKASGDMFQPVDEVIITSDNVESIITQYDIEDTMASDLRSLATNPDAENIRAYLPCQNMTRGTSTSYFPHDGFTLRLTAISASRNAGPENMGAERFKIARGSAAEQMAQNAQLFTLNTITTALSTVNVEIGIAVYIFDTLASIFNYQWYGYADEYLQVAVDEDKSRRYVYVDYENYAFPRAIDDHGNFRFWVEAGRTTDSSTEGEFTDTEYFTPQLSDDEFFDKAIYFTGRYDYETPLKYQDTYGYFRYQNSNIHITSLNV